MPTLKMFFEITQLNPVQLYKIQDWGGYKKYCNFLVLEYTQFYLTSDDLKRYTHIIALSHELLQVEYFRI